ncbi:helix-turn-helix transcriptional regulator [Candidatus Poriferisodalis sp.]|uniref:helix-turn-helix transcriptional regulator n=1 Tax=Candidatus Poriferisodalis sp. TaxID=3101277 RepID=UPI003B02A3BC
MAAGSGAQRPDATERVMELMMYLLARDVPKTRAEIWRDTGLYAPDGTTDRLLRQSARATFERDKAVIRNLGVRITESMEHDGATSYTIRRRDYFLPELSLTPEEQVALQFAAAHVDIGETWDLEAVAKLTNAPDGAVAHAGAASSASAGVELDTASAADAQARALLPTLAAAAADRAEVRFRYSGRDRKVSPLGLLGRSPHWYLAALEGDVAKTFRVDRMEGGVTVGEPGAFTERADIDVAGLLPSDPMQIDVGDDFVARVRIDNVVAQQPTAERGEIVARDDDGSVTLEITVRNRTAFRTWLLDMGRHAVVLEPPELVSDIVDWLSALAGGEPS